MTSTSCKEIAREVLEHALAGRAPEELPFLDVQRYLSGLGVRVPRLLLDEARRGLVVLEDLGDRTLEMALSDPSCGGARAIYSTAIRQLARLRAHAERDSLRRCVAYTRAFDFDQPLAAVHHTSSPGAGASHLAAWILWPSR